MKSEQKAMRVAVTVLGLLTSFPLMAHSACPKIYTLFYTYDTKDALKAMRWKQKQYRAMGCPSPSGELRQQDFRSRQDVIKYLDDHPVDYLIIIHQQNYRSEIWQPLGSVTGDVNMTVWGPKAYNVPYHRFIVYRRNINGPIVASSGTWLGTRSGPAGTLKVAFKEVMKDALRDRPLPAGK